MVGRGRAALLVVAILALSATASPALAATPAATAANRASPVADLDGRPLQLVEVAQHFCEDFSYPAIHCYSSAADLEASVKPILAATSLDYVVVFDYTNFAGPYMYMSQDYTVLAVIGWNDRISSLKALNSLSSTFYTDWFYGGTSYGICCNWQLSGLGSFDNTFSSFHT
jgi:hypothetical protein